MLRESRLQSLLRRYSRLQDLGASLLTGLGAFLYLFFALRMPVDGMEVPLRFSHDSMPFLAQIKGTVETGWWWFNPAIGAPQGFQALLFPSVSNVDQVLVWFLSWLSRNPVVVSNAVWMLIVALSGVTAYWSLRALGISRLSALVCGVLFALTPYALYRNIEHLSLAIYLIPPLCGLALRLAMSSPGKAQPNPPGGLLIGTILLCFNYIYYTFFGCFLLVVSTLVGALSSRSLAVVRRGFAIFLVMLACTALNLAPSFVAVKRFGRPITIDTKVPAESEVHGLKIRHLVSPVLQHPFPPFDAWGRKESDAQFPFEAENSSARLGLVGAIGFLTALAALFIRLPSEESGAQSLIVASGQLILLMLLLATVGGFGSLFSLLITPDIRGWNRICPFIAFMSIVPIGCGLDWLRSRVRLAPLIFAGVLAVGLWDQSAALNSLVVSRDANAKEFQAVERMAQRLAARLPPGAMVLQLPFVPYLSETGLFGMQPYDHFKPYFASMNTLRWSYPAMTNEQFWWQEAASALTPAELAPSAVRDGFSAILVDTAGYADAGTEITVGLQAAGALPIVEDGRYRAFSLGQVPPGPTVRQRAHPIAGLVRCDGEPLYVIDLVNGQRPRPDTEFAVDRGEELRIWGWFVIPSKGTAALALEFVLDGAASPAAYGFHRPDVAAYYNDPDYKPSGFRVIVPPNHLQPGIHSFQFRGLAHDRSCYVETSRYSIAVR